MKIIETYILLHEVKSFGNTTSDWVKVYKAIDFDQVKYFREDVGSVVLLSDAEIIKMKLDTENFLKDKI